MFDAKAFAKKKLPPVPGKKPLPDDGGAGPGAKPPAPAPFPQGGAEERVAQARPKAPAGGVPSYLQKDEEDPNGPPSSQREMMGQQEEDPDSARLEGHGMPNDGAPFDSGEDRMDVGAAQPNDKGSPDFEDEPLDPDQDFGPLSQRGAAPPDPNADPNAQPDPNDPGAQMTDETRDPYAGNDAVSTVAEIEERKNPMRAWATFKRTAPFLGKGQPVSMSGSNQADGVRRG